MNAQHDKLIEVLREARELLSRPNNDFAWSSWDDAPAALREVDGLIVRIQSGDLPKRSDVNVLFLPTGPIQEVSVSSGWGQEFLELAKRFDSALARAYGENGSEHKEITDPSFGAADYWVQVTGGRLRWLATVLAIASIPLFFDVLSEGEKAEFYFPLHVKGRAALWTTGITCVLWTAIAIVNWKNWLRRKNAS